VLRKLGAVEQKRETERYSVERTENLETERLLIHRLGLTVLLTLSCDRFLHDHE